MRLRLVAVTEMNAHNLLGMTCEEFTTCAQSHGLGLFDARRIYTAVFRKGAPPPEGFILDIPALSLRSQDEDARKFTLMLKDGLETESVILHQPGSTGRPRTTLCVSSQIGCALGCTFCETARLGLLCNLPCSLIVAQWYTARFSCLQTVDNIVFMGMGEPLDNFDQVVHAIRILTDQRGAAIPPSRITISTVGRCAGIRRLADEMEERNKTGGGGWVNLAVSVNAPHDTVRSSLMPINRAEPMGALRAAMLEWCARSGRRVFIEYVLIPGVNDAPEQAAELCAYLAGLDCTVNVIPYNPRRHSPWPAPPEKTIHNFTAAIAARGLRVTRRRTRGRSDRAGCGQLGNQPIRCRRKPIPNPG